MEGVSFDDAGATRGDGDSMLYADHIFWAGDLNYRINMGHGGTLDEFNRVKKLAIEGKLQPLIACDQLRREMTAGRVFPGWVEAEIDFRPSYRMERGVDMYNNKKNQNPSYCDRVLWRSLPGFVDHVEPMSYESHMDMMQSDHRPVSATFKVHTKVCFVNVRPVKHVDLRGYCQLTFSDVTLEGAPEIDYAAALAEAEDQSGFGTCRMCGKVLNDKSKTVDAHAQKANNSLLYCNATCERRAKALGADEEQSLDGGKKKKKKKKKLGGKKVLGMLLGNAKKVSSAAAAGAKAIKAAGDGAGNAVRRGLTKGDKDAFTEASEGLDGFAAEKEEEGGEEGDRVSLEFFASEFLGGAKASALARCDDGAGDPTSAKGRVLWKWSENELPVLVPFVNDVAWLQRQHLSILVKDGKGRVRGQVRLWWSLAVHFFCLLLSLFCLLSVLVLFLFCSSLSFAASSARVRTPLFGVVCARSIIHSRPHATTTTTTTTTAVSLSGVALPARSSLGGVQQGVGALQGAACLPRRCNRHTVGYVDSDSRRHAAVRGAGRRRDAKHVVGSQAVGKTGGGRRHATLHRRRSAVAEQIARTNSRKRLHDASIRIDGAAAAAARARRVRRAAAAAAARCRSRRDRASAGSSSARAAAGEGAEARREPRELEIARAHECVAAAARAERRRGEREQLQQRELGASAARAWAGHCGRARCTGAVHADEQWCVGGFARRLSFARGSVARVFASALRSTLGSPSSAPAARNSTPHVSTAKPGTPPPPPPSADDAPPPPPPPSTAGSAASASSTGSPPTSSLTTSPTSSPTSSPKPAKPPKPSKAARMRPSKVGRVDALLKKQAPQQL
jgi:hypothetical protein